MSGQDILKNSGFTGCLAKAGLDEGTNSGTIKIATGDGEGIHYGIDGIGYYKADTDNIAVTAHAQQADDTSCLYLVQINASGTISTKKGIERATAALGVTQNLQWPFPDEDSCPIGGYKVECDGATFTNGTTDHSASNITVTYYDFVMGMPSAPQVS